MGASSASFFKTNGRKVRWKSDRAVVGPGELGSPSLGAVGFGFDGEAVAAVLDLPKKFAISDRDLA